MKHLAGFFVSFFLFFQFALGQKESEKAYEYLNRRGEVYFSFPNPGRERLTELGTIISIDLVNKDSVYAYASKSEFPVFETKSIPFTVLIPAGERFHPKAPATGNWDFYPSYDQYEHMMQEFENTFPDLCHLFSIGKSVDNRDLLFVRITSGQKASHLKPKVMHTASMHGDELVGFVLMLRLIDHLLSNYGVDEQTTRLVDELEIYINPLFNPDGAYFGGDGNTITAPIRSNANNIDLNRNFPDPRAGDVPGGEHQPETIALMSFLDTVLITLSANYHGGAEVVNFPWDTWVKRHADHTWFRSISKQYADTVHFYGPAGYFRNPSPQGYIKGSDWYIVTGGQQDYMTYFKGGREVIIELSMDKFPAPGNLPDYWEYNHRALIQFMEHALHGIRGTVQSSVSGETLEAKIELVDFDIDSSWTYSRASSGAFFRMAAPGVYSLKASSPGYQSKTFNILQVTEKNAIELNILLEPEKIPSETDSISVFPNPVVTSGNLMIRISEPAVIQMDVFDQTGRKTYSSLPTEHEAGEIYQSLDAGMLRPGLNLLRIQVGKIAHVRKVLFTPQALK
jgi:hypothetical protein